MGNLPRKAEWDAAINRSAPRGLTHAVYRPFYGVGTAIGYTKSPPDKA